MFSKFQPFQSHLELAHHYWEEIVSPGDCVIDATCGNGHDTLKLAQLVLTEESGEVFAIDVQASALEKSRELLSQNLSPTLFQRVHWIAQSHENFPQTILPESVKLIVYNFGYLPGGDKSFTTKTDTTLQSIKQALKLLYKGGALSLTCYPGHPEGAVEEAQLGEFLASLSPREWSVCHHVWRNRRNAPSLFLICRTVANSQ